MCVQGRLPLGTPARPEIPHSDDLQSASLGFWSRRIDDEHRLVHGATDDELIIIQARYHYDG